ncbi:hypothetical protein NAEGRDRAFT_82308 [Naegleria gruberi]|uniref:Uncharacterized protein n=1 Tax=Naegleria gruberi TaxID=5762 RepID=D2W4E2_NAEGR|nr:uncharacterized protein NAEGRDRAFT_82308 [Naegleria gruberi]EFC36060.1 hypothetical protein NAEGRDRAFT_82308 [Naegleria gruberi]|eukprot:XP_002668804.1 hypothetical protein NAEGRDRAFT_82308 [Naegleria gruberi strain NEG-M]
MNSLPTDTILYLMDFMIIPSGEYKNIFSLNRHWKEATEENPEFWLRQLAGLFFMICKEKENIGGDSNTELPSPTSSSSSTLDQSKSITTGHQLFSIQGLNYFQFYCKFFCNRKGMHHLMKHQPVLKKIFKKVADFLVIIEMREHNEKIEDFSLIRKTFLNLNSNIKGYVKTKFEKEKLSMLTHSKVFDYYQQYQFFFKDEYEINQDLINSKTDTSYDVYWTYLLSYTKSIEQQKGLDLLQLFLDNNIYSKQYFIRKVATLILLLTLSEIEDESYREKVFELLLKILKKYFQTSIASNFTAKYEKGSELFSFMLFDPYETARIKLKYIERVKQEIAPSIVSKGFDKQAKDLKIIYTQTELIDLVGSTDFYQLIGYILQNFHCDPVMLDKILSRAINRITILEFYKQSKITYSKVCNLKFFISNDDFQFEFEEVLPIILKHYETDGKDMRQLIKDFQKSTEPFNEILRLGNNLEMLRIRLRYFFKLYSQFFTKDQIKMFLKHAYFHSGMIGQSHNIEVTKIFFEDYQLTPSDCSMVVTSINPSIFKWTEDIQNAVHNFPSKFTPHKKPKEFKMHPIVNHILTRRDRDHIGNLDGFVEICGDDRVVIPLLLDHNGASRDVKQHIYVDYMEQKKKEQAYRYVIKYITLKELIKSPNMKILY